MVSGIVVMIRESLNRQEVDQPKRTLNHRAERDGRDTEINSQLCLHNRQFFPTLL